MIKFHIWLLKNIHVQNVITTEVNVTSVNLNRADKHLNVQWRQQTMTD